MPMRLDRVMTNRWRCRMVYAAMLARMGSGPPVTLRRGREMSEAVTFAPIRAGPSMVEDRRKPSQSASAGASPATVVRYINR